MKKEQEKAVETASKAEAQNAKKAKPANKKPNFFVRCGRKIREVFLELKKVTWPKGGQAWKETGVVLVVCLAFLIVLTLFDLGLGALVGLITKI